MGLYDREWFWEGYEDRYGFKKKSEKSNSQREESIKNLETVGIRRYCKYCSRIVDINVDKSALTSPSLGYIFVCPVCRKRNKVWRRPTFIEVLKTLMKIILGAFFICIILLILFRL